MYNFDDVGMEGNIRFGIETDGVRETVVLSWGYILNNTLPELTYAKKMFPYNKETEAGESLYQGDVISLKAVDVDENDLFWGSNAGAKMKDKGIDEFVIHLTESAQQPLNGVMYAVKDDKPVTDSVFYGFELEEGSADDIWRENDTTILFINYLLKKGAKLIGNEWENPELVDRFEV